MSGAHGAGPPEDDAGPDDAQVPAPDGLAVDDDHAQYTPDRSPFGRPPRTPILARTFPVSQQVDAKDYPRRSIRWPLSMLA